MNPQGVVVPLDDVRVSGRLARRIKCLRRRSQGPGKQDETEGKDGGQCPGRVSTQEEHVIQDLLPRSLGIKGVMGASYKSGLAAVTGSVRRKGSK